MRTSFHHRPEAQHPNFPLSVSWQADYPIFAPKVDKEAEVSACPLCANRRPSATRQTTSYSITSLARTKQYWVGPGNVVLSKGPEIDLS